MWGKALRATAVGILLTTGMVVARGDGIATVEDIDLFFRDEMLIVAWSAEGEAHLLAIVDALRVVLGVTDALDESSEDEVGQFAVSEDLRSVVVRLAQAYFELGNAFSGGPLDPLTAFTRGKHWGLKGLRMRPQFAQAEREQGFEAAVAQETDVGLLFWTCLCWLRCAEASPLVAAVSGTPMKALSMLERCADLDPGYAACGPYRALAGFWGALPDLPFTLLCRNLDLALRYSCQAITADPLCPERCDGRPDCERFLENRLTFVKYYLLPSHQDEQAARILEEIVRFSWDGFYPLHNPRARQEARQLLESLFERPTD